MEKKSNTNIVDIIYLFLLSQGIITFIISSIVYLLKGDTLSFYLKLLVAVISFGFAAIIYILKNKDKIKR